MIYAAELFFDPSSEAAIHKYWTAFRDEGISTYMLDRGATPHVTLGMFQNIDESRFTKILRDFATKQHSFYFQLSSLGLFTTPKACLYLAPVVTRSLLDLHYRFHQTFSSFDHSGWEYYLPEQWVPHCALDISLRDTGVAGSTYYMMKHFIPYSDR